MTWNAPFTAVANVGLTANQWNVYVRDNFNETAVAKATAAGQLIVSTALNTIAARTPQSAANNGSETTTSTSYAAPTAGTAGPSVTATTGTKAAVFICGLIQPGSTGGEGFISYAVSGATTIAADDSRAIRYTSYNPSSAVRTTLMDFPTTLTGGSNTFTMQFKVSTGTAGIDDRQILVIPLS